MRRFGFIVALALWFSACVGSQDDLSQVIDLRVLGMAFEPPEAMAVSCEPGPVGAAAATEVTLTALIADPKGDGRDIAYSLRTCVNQGDRTCSNEGEFISVGSGTVDAGSVTIVKLRLGLSTYPVMDGGASDGGTRVFLEEVRAANVFQGLGGLRVPVVLRVRAGDEEIYAQKLMVYNCPIVEGMKKNVTPVLPGIRLDREPWPEGTLRTLSGGQAIFELDDFSALEEPYVVPSYELKPVVLTEAWKVAWHTTMGRLGPTETGGVDQGGQASRHKTTWTPGAAPKEGPVTFWFVVRDGRGGESWTSRTGYYVP